MIGAMLKLGSCWSYYDYVLVQQYVLQLCEVVKIKSCQPKRQAHRSLYTYSLQLAANCCSRLLPYDIIILNLGPDVAR